MTPKISFLGCTYNNDMYIADTIESLLDQTEKNMEVIYVNDGSTDGTRDILEFYSRKDARIRYLNLEENQGISKAWNKGLALVRGPIIGIISGDDVYFPKRAATHINLSGVGDAVVTYGAYLRTNAVLVPWKGKLQDGSDAKQFTPVPYTKGCLDIKQTIPHGFMSVSTKLALQVPMQEELRSGADYPYLRDLEKAGAAFVSSIEVLGLYRHHSRMVTRTRRQEIDAATKSTGARSEVSYGK